MLRSPVASAVCLIRLAVIDFTVATLIRGDDALRQQPDSKPPESQREKQSAKQGSGRSKAVATSLPYTIMK
jgi:hypothetical protein